MIFVDTRVIHDLDTLEYNMDEGHDTLRETIRAKFDASEATITHKYTQIHTNTHKYTQLHTNTHRVLCACGNATLARRH